MSELGFSNIFSGATMMSLPREVLLEISKWLSLEERMIYLAPVCRYLYDVMHDSSLWRTVYSNAEFTLHSFNSLFRHDRDLRHLGFRHSQRPLTFITDAFFIEQKLMNCCNLISLDLGYNTSISSLHFVRHMPSLRELDITSCQNITLESLVTSLYKKNTLEILRMPNCFQVGGISLVSVVKSLPDIKIIDAGGCETISENQARDILQNCQLSEFSFSPNWDHPNLWERLFTDFKHVKLGYLTL